MSASVKNNKSALVQLIIITTVTLIFSACQSENNVDKEPSIVGAIEDVQSWYDAIDPNSSIRMDISVPVPNDYECAPYTDINASPRPCTLEDVKADNDPYDAYEPGIHVIFDSSEFSSNNQANASLEQKGKSTREAPQDSFRLRLDSKTNLYNNEETFQFNKHPYEDSRMKNKLFFDVFTEIPNFTSLRTRFVNLFIDGVDYGLFTHIEYGDERFLLNRGWSEEDNLYKAQNFDYRMGTKFTLDNKGDPLYPEEFEASLEPKSGKDLEKLVEMLTALEKVQNDPVAFEKFFNQYFDRENYITWMAINIITSNNDTISQNFYLLNPKYSDKFYLLPWDYDGAGFYEKSELPKWQYGYGTWWDVPLHRGFLSTQQNREDLDLKIQELRADQFRDENLNAKIAGYKTVVEPFISQAPDADHLTHEEWLTAVNNLTPKIQENLDYYEQEIGVPMPFWQAASYTEGTLSLSWSQSIDLENDPLIYDLKIARDINMSDVIFTVLDIPDVSSLKDGNIYYTKDINLTTGTYYMQVISKEENNASSYQIAFDQLRDENDNKFFGVFSFDVQ